MINTYLAYLKPFLIVILFCWSGTVMSQTITSVIPTNGTAGQSVNMIITGSNTWFVGSSGPVLNGPGGQLKPSSWIATSNTSITANYNFAPTTTPGNYSLFVDWWSLPTATWSGTFSLAPSPAGTWGLVTGKVISDQNQNCTDDFGDVDIANQIVAIQPGNYYGTTDFNGEYAIWVPLGTYSISTSVSGNQSFLCPLTGSQSVTLTVAGDTVGNNDFFIANSTQNPFNNLKVLSTTGFHRPGFRSTTTFSVSNTGNQTMGGFSLTANVDGGMFHLSETPAAANVSSNATNHTITWNIPGLLPGNSVIFTSHDSLPASIPLGTNLFHDATISPGDDHNPDNTTTSFRTVTGSYDPNDKQVWNGDSENADGFIEIQDTVLTYLIRCQNTGTDTAFNIYIRDTIDTDLDLTTLQVTDASHPYQLSVTGQGYVQFLFPNILLVDSTTNEPESHGHIEYTIKRKPGLPIGTQIDNTASIYFDFNAPIVTNTVSSVICPEIGSGYGGSLAGQTLTLSDSATGTGLTYLWKFGDGNTSTQANPTHTYASPGGYTVCQIVSNSCGRIDSTCQTFAVGCSFPTATFNSSSVEYVATFNDQSTGAPISWFWDFGDGNTSTLQNPTHTYAAEGTYTVCLITTNVCGPDTSCSPVTITCPRPSSNYNTLANQLQVDFFDQTTGSPISWFWDFGDGNTSTQQNPVHTYAVEGTYTVCLITTNSCGSDTTCGPVMISCPRPTSNFSFLPNQLTLNFFDLTGNSPTTWFWDFGDGNTSTQQNPVHSYAVEGTYTVCLITTNDCGNDTSCSTVTISCPAPVAQFSYLASNPQTVTFTDLSTNAGNWLWTFGDGNSSVNQNPTHTYALAGQYTVCLSLLTGCGTDTTCQGVVVLVGVEDTDLDWLELYPNPTDGMLRVDLETLVGSELEFSIFDGMGRLVEQLDAGMVSGRLRQEFDLGGQAAGIYFLRIDVNGKVITRRVVRE